MIVGAGSAESSLFDPTRSDSAYVGKGQARAASVPVYGDPALWQRVPDGALRYVAERCDPEMLKAALRDLLARAATVTSS